MSGYNLDSCGVYSALEQIAAISGSAKETALQAYLQDQRFLESVIWAYDPFITFGVKKLPDAEPGNGTFDHQTEYLLNGLASRGLTGTAAQTAIASELRRLTPASQELLRRILTKDLRAGFGASTVNRVAPGTIYVFKCMLAHPFDPKRIADDDMVAVEPKYDGVRALAIYKQGQVNLYSRTGKEFTNFQHIADILRNLILMHPKVPDHGHYVFDGELCSGQFNQTVGDIHKKDTQAADTRFYAFDFVPFSIFSTGRQHPQFVYSARRKLLEQIVGADNAGLVRVPPLTYCETVEEIMAVYDGIRQSGGEGVIVKRLEGHYEPKRSYNWLKIKDQQTLDLPIIGMEEGTGKYAGSLGALVVDHKGVSVNVGSGLTDADRALFWRESPVGKIAEIEFHEETPDGSLRHPRFVRIRDDKTLEDGPGC